MTDNLQQWEVQSHLGSDPFGSPGMLRGLWEFRAGCQGDSHFRLEKREEGETGKTDESISTR